MKESYKNKSEEKFNNYFKQYQKLRLTKRGYPDFMLIENNKCIGFVEVKRSAKQRVKPEQEIFRQFCKENNIFWFRWNSF